MGEIKTGGDGNLLEEGVVGRGQHAVLGGNAAGFKGGEGDFLGGFDVVEVALQDGEAATGHARVARAEFEEFNGDAFEGALGGLMLQETVGVSSTQMGPSPTLRTLPRMA